MRSEPPFSVCPSSACDSSLYLISYHHVMFVYVKCPLFKLCGVLSPDWIQADTGNNLLPLLLKNHLVADFLLNLPEGVHQRGELASACTTKDESATMCRNVQGHFISCDAEPDWRKALRVKERDLTEQCLLMGSREVSGKLSGPCQQHLERG